MTRVLGITGSIGSGKSTVGDILRSMDVPVIDTDHIVHEILRESRTTKKAILERFGSKILVDGTDDEIDRTSLGKLIFADERCRKDLESIIHPEVLLEYRRRVKRYADSPVVAVLVPLLFEVGIASEFDEVWTVICTEAELKKRLKQRNDMIEEEINRRLAAQIPQEEKAARSHQVIDNSLSLENTRKQIVSLLKGALDN